MWVQRDRFYQPTHIKTYVAVFRKKSVHYYLSIVRTSGQEFTFIIYGYLIYGHSSAF